MNEDLDRDSFDTASPTHQQEGFPYHTYHLPTMRYSHTTIASPQHVVSPHRAADTLPEQSRRTLPSFGESELSPSLLQNPEEAASPHIALRSMPPSPVGRIQFPSPSPPIGIEHRRRDSDILEDTIPYYLETLVAHAAHRGINMVTAIILVLGIVTMYQFKSYHDHRAPLNIDADREPATPPVYSPEQVDALLRRNKEQITDYFTRTTNDFLASIQQRFSDIQLQINRNEQNIDSYSGNINKTEQQLQALQDGVNAIPDLNGVDPTVIREMQQNYEHQKRVNYIERIAHRPRVIPYGRESEYVFEYNNEALEQEGYIASFTNTMKTGLEAFHEHHRQPVNDIVDRPKVNIAHADTAATLQPQDCLQFDARDNWIELQLSQKIKPTHFEYIHIEKTKIDRDDRVHSPKRFDLFGKLSSDDEWMPIDIEEGQNEILDVDHSSIRLQLIPKHDVKFIRVQYETNEDALFTRLYRLRIESDGEVVQRYTHQNDQ